MRADDPTALHDSKESSTHGREENDCGSRPFDCTTQRGGAEAPTEVREQQHSGGRRFDCNTQCGGGAHTRTQKKNDAVGASDSTALRSGWKAPTQGREKKTRWRQAVRLDHSARGRRRQEQSEKASLKKQAIRLHYSVRENSRHKED